MSSFKKYTEELSIPMFVPPIVAFVFAMFFLLLAMKMAPDRKDTDESPVKLEKVENPLTEVKSHPYINGYESTSTNVYIDDKQIPFMQQSTKNFAAPNLNESCKDGDLK